MVFPISACSQLFNGVSSFFEVINCGSISIVRLDLALGGRGEQMCDLPSSPLEIPGDRMYRGHLQAPDLGVFFGTSSSAFLSF